MFKTIVPITLEKHKNKKIKPINNFEFAKGVHIASVMAHEFPKVSSVYPIVFIEDKANDEFKPVAMLGLEQGENLFLSEDAKKWNASYIPAIIRRYPFALAKSGEENRFTVCIDETSEFLNDSEGEALFNEDNTPAPTIEKVKQYLSELHQMDLFTSQFCHFLKENNLFTPLNMKVRVKNEMKNISGAYVINEERLNSLSDEKFIDIKNKRYLSVIYSHLSSLAQIERLLGFKDKTLAETAKIEERFEEIDDSTKAESKKTKK